MQATPQRAEGNQTRLATNEGAYRHAHGDRSSPTDTLALPQTTRAGDNGATLATRQFHDHGTGSTTNGAVLLMVDDHSVEVSQLLRALADASGEERARLRSRIMELVYDELHVMARRQGRGAPDSESVRPTVLVHEAWLRMSRRESFESRRELYGIARRAMRQFLIDWGRKRRTRGPVMALDGIDLADAPVVDVIEVYDALDRLRELDARQATVVELKCLLGQTIDQIAETLGVSHATIERDWRAARAKLRSLLSPPPPLPEDSR